MKPITIGYGDEKITFYLRMISVADEERYTQKFNDISEVDPEKYDKEFALYRDALGEFSDKMPTVSANGKSKPMDKNGSTSDAIAARFKEKTIENERIVRAAYVLFRNQLDPEISFL